MNRKVPLVILGVAVVGVLVVFNLQLRGDPEPEAEPIENPTRLRDPERRLSWRNHQVADTPDEAEDGPDAPVAAAHEPEPEEPPSELEDADCAHPFVPSRTETVRTYRWTQSGQDWIIRLRMESVGAELRDDAEPVVRWRVRTSSENDGLEAGDTIVEAACNPGISAEEPWFGILERSVGHRTTEASGRWRWPVELRAGQRIAGTMVFDASRSDARAAEGQQAGGTLRVSREHIVGERETIEVPAGRFLAWRIEYEERQEYSGGRNETGTGILWLAEGIGLVKSQAENSSGVVMTRVLTAHSDP